MTHERQYDTKTLITEEFRSLINTTEKLKSRYEKYPRELIRSKADLFFAKTGSTIADMADIKMHTVIVQWVHTTLHQKELEDPE